MSDVVIRAEGLGKKYVIGHQTRSDRHRTLRDTIGVTINALARSARDMAAGRQLVTGDAVEEVWALQDVSFEIKRGEVVGIIGRNGAGKSTLLKILSRITEPSAGRIEIRGRISSLLEVGTGFHPELTGRENIYLNGAILGMARAEIKRKFDEIVDFSGIEKFLDTPVKRYSSGMYLRLAFAVAAHLEPEILVVDEVLAVGDAEFQKKCLGKIGEVAGHGRTVLFVSHNMGAVQELCSSCILLSNGRVEINAKAIDAISAYLSRKDKEPNSSNAYVGRNFTIYRVTLTDKTTGIPSAMFRKDSAIELSLELIVNSDDPNLHVGYAIYADASRALWWSFFGDSSGDIGLKKGNYRLSTMLPRFLLNDGHYSIEVIAAQHNHGWILPPTYQDILKKFTISGGSLGSSHISATTRPGFLMPVFDWQVEYANTVRL